MNNDHSAPDPRSSSISNPSSSSPPNRPPPLTSTNRPPPPPPRVPPPSSRPPPTTGPSSARPSIFSFLPRNNPSTNIPASGSANITNTPPTSSVSRPSIGPSLPTSRQAAIASTAENIAAGIIANATGTATGGGGVGGVGGPGGRGVVNRDILNAAKTVRSEKIRFLKDLLKNLDALVYAHLSYLYYLDNSLLLFLFRGSMVQLSFLTPKPAVLPPVPLHRLVLISIIGSATLCFLIHTLSDAPSAGEASGGYLHGGILIDFIGQATPISRVRLGILDGIVMLLQLFMLSATLSLRALTHKKVRRQDLDSEERGVHRDSLDLEAGATNATRVNAESPPTSSDDEESPLFNSEPPAEELDNLYEAYAGELVVADIRLIDMMKNLWFGPREELRLRPGTV